MRLRTLIFYAKFRINRQSDQASRLRLQRLRIFRSEINGSLPWHSPQTTACKAWLGTCLEWGQGNPRFSPLFPKSPVKKKNRTTLNRSALCLGGGGEIRTHGRVYSSPVFKTGAFNHSATPPEFFSERLIQASRQGRNDSKQSTEIVVLGNDDVVDEVA